MPSPFPGMDPWLEAPGLFPDLHQRLIAYLSEAVSATLPAPYYTAIATRLYVESSRRHIEPDVDVLVPRRHRPRAAPGGGVAVLGKPKPLVFRVADDPIREWALEIRRSDSGDRFVTSVEVLSLSNKLRGTEGRKQYLKKRRELREGKVNIFEIDLLRAGAPTTLAPLERAERRAGPFDYHICARRYYRSLSTEVYPIAMAERLPLIAVPLLKGDPDITVDFQAVLDRSYAVGLFDRRADYSKPCDPPLTPEQQAWAEDILKSNGVP